LRHISSPSCSGYLETGSQFCPGQPGPQSYFKLPTTAGMTGAYHHSQLFFC
jgi:hypothetical protein